MDKLKDAIYEFLTVYSWSYLDPDVLFSPTADGVLVRTRDGDVEFKWAEITELREPVWAGKLFDRVDPFMRGKLVTNQGEFYTSKITEKIKNAIINKSGLAYTGTSFWLSQRVYKKRTL